MVHSESSVLSSLRGGSDFSKDEVATSVSGNGSYTDPVVRRKSKRFKVAAESELSPDCGSVSKRLRSRSIQKEVLIETCENRNVSDDCVLSSEAEVVLIPRENVVAQDRLISIDVHFCKDIDVGVTESAESHRVNLQTQLKDKNLLGNTSELYTVEVQPPSISLQEDAVVGSVYRQSITTRKQLRGRTISVVRDFPPNMGSIFPKSGKTFEVPISVEEKHFVLRNSDSGDHLSQSPDEIISPEVLEPSELEKEKSKVTVPKPIEAAGRRGTHIIGTVPGVEVGHGFQYRMELNSLGIHRPSQGGIDYMKDDSGELVALSIVSSGNYDDVLDNSDVLIYTGQGGNVGKGKKNIEPKDQQLVRGNLALKNSIHKKNPVRVIRGYKNTTLESSAAVKNYVYDGLYLVEEYWEETGSHGKLVFKFKLRRIPGQPERSWKVVENSKKSELREDVCNVDISEGKEALPIRAVNNLDDEKPPPFIYTVKMIYPYWCRPIPPKSCGCTKRCSESKNCSCVAKNDGKIPYNYDGAILEVKPLVYECGPHCKCPPSCYMRVSQHGIKIQLELFKTESRGWGVRSLESVPVGSFICEYAGELLEDKQAEILTGKDEYLFNLGKEEDPFTIDAAREGNIGRFINHSCSPNMYAQDVLYDHDETRIPHVMFFAQENIRPLEELTYDYNYKIDQVRDSNGNIKKKFCYCGSAECSGRLY
ncbi:hypothetical protein CARUB_v10022753mg [Capsella rubella]|uniref:Histone-lysine N-methyltransferase n=1 Tax=Capsella rubella TaxID=81985 RepID=R0HN56_9BRAS|nr:histone-lysine N-methyltransferase, H3 lysine-9 specific SUVH5 [Capsella rubella]EOA26675.1 hypothetical protein CARUB_v10022753mg [Capsella rubella]